MKINQRELLHYIVGGFFLLIAWLPLMALTNNNVVLTSILWLIWYIFIDQLAHIIIMGKKQSIMK